MEVEHTHVWALMFVIIHSLFHESYHHVRQLDHSNISMKR